MSNNFDSNISEKLAQSFLKGAESQRVLTKTVNTQIFSGQFDGSTGDTVSVKRPTDFRSETTPDGNLNSSTASSIVTGKASATVQDMRTVWVEYSIVDQALKMDQLDQLLMPMGRRMIVDEETAFAKFMMANTGLKSGTVGTAVSEWKDVANAAALMKSSGIPEGDEWFYTMNPFTTTNLADAQIGLSSGSNNLVDTAWAKAQIPRNFGGMQAISATTLGSYNSGDATDRAGTLAATPSGTYIAHKDSMVQSLAVAGFSNDAVIRAGQVISVAGRNRLNLSTRMPIFDASGNEIVWTATVVADVTLDASGTGTLLVTGPAINETDGQYNTVSSALTSGDVVTLLGTENTNIQPNMFYHKDAFTFTSVHIPKLNNTDTTFETADGIQMRVSKGSDVKGNSQLVRFDLLPAYGVLNPFYAGQGFGS